MTELLEEGLSIHFSGSVACAFADFPLHRLMWSFAKGICARSWEKSNRTQKVWTIAFNAFGIISQVSASIGEFFHWCMFARLHLLCHAFRHDLDRFGGLSFYKIDVLESAGDEGLMMMRMYDWWMMYDVWCMMMDDDLKPRLKHVSWPFVHS